MPGFAASYPRISYNYGKELHWEMDYLFIYLFIFGGIIQNNYLAFIYFIFYFKRERNAEYDRKTTRTTVKHGLLCCKTRLALNVVTSSCTLSSSKA